MCLSVCKARDGIGTSVINRDATCGGIKKRSARKYYVGGIPNAFI